MLKSATHLQKHKERVHKERRSELEEGISASSCEEPTADNSKCQLCGKILKSAANLSNHMDKVHKAQKNPSQKGLTTSSIE